ncbi:MAG: SPOR domain-containing protein [Candidatus Aminicenantes bacterium]|nr:SPOR domain-containing protein [Candidatus Aminicenantes bacterium]
MAKRGRELQFATHQLVGVFLGLIALCAFVFLLGISMGSKKTSLAAKAGEKTAKPAIPAGTIQSELDAHARSAGPEAKPGAIVPKADPPAVKSGAAAPASGPGEKPAVKPSDKPADKPENKPLDKPAAKTTAPSAEVKKPAQAPAVTAGVWYVQVAAVDERAAAESVARKLEKDGFPTLVLDPLARDKRTVYRVRVGPYENKAEADKARIKLAEAAKKKNADYFLVKG